MVVKIDSEDRSTGKGRDKQIKFTRKKKKTERNELGKGKLAFLFPAKGSTFFIFPLLT
jgi:hypothetical protein